MNLAANRFSFLLLLAAMITFPAFAAAYIDPGVGSILLQVILAAIFGSILFIKILWHRLRDAAVRLFTRSTPAPAENEDQ